MSQNKKVTAGRMGVCVIFGICSLVFFVISILFDSFEYIMSKDGLKTVIVKSDFQEIGIADNIADGVLEIIPPEITEKYNITRRDIELVIENDDVKEFVGEKFGSAASYVFTGEGDVQLSSSEICDLLEKNPELIEEVTGVTPTDATYQRIEKRLRAVNTKLDLRRYIDKTEGVSQIRNAKFLFSKWWTIGFAIAGVLNLLFIFLICKRRFIYLFSFAGIISLIYAAIIYLSCGIIAKKTLASSNKALVEAIMGTFTTRMHIGFFIGIIMGAIEIALVIIIRTFSFFSKNEE